MPDRLALIRGINVGGKNLIKMADLRAGFEELGFEDVATYIQSGNVLFRSPPEQRDELAGRLEAGLKKTFGIDLRVVTLTTAQLRKVVDGAPAGFGAEDRLSDVIFIRRPLTVARLFGIAETREGIDGKWKGAGVVYFSRLAERASGSRLSKIVALPEYKNVTIRSWGTTRRLLAAFDDRAAK